MFFIYLFMGHKCIWQGPLFITSLKISSRYYWWVMFLNDCRLYGKDIVTVLLNEFWNSSFRNEWIEIHFYVRIVSNLEWHCVCVQITWLILGDLSNFFLCRSFDKTEYLAGQSESMAVSVESHICLPGKGNRYLIKKGFSENHWAFTNNPNSIIQVYISNAFNQQN